MSVKETEPAAAEPPFEERQEEVPLPGEESAKLSGYPAALATLRAPDPPEMFEPLLEEGLALLEEGGDMAAAQARLERAAAIRADDPDLAHALGIIYGRLALERLKHPGPSMLTGDVDGQTTLARAIFCTIRAIELDGRRPDAWNNLATLYAVRGDRALAVEALKRSLQILPDQPHVRDRLEELGEF